MDQGKASKAMRPPLNQRLLPRGAAREVGRRLTLATFSRIMKPRTRVALAQPRIQNLYLHFVPPRGEKAFLNMIRELKRTHSFISYSQATRAVNDGTIDEPMLSISFDDGFETNLRAAEILSSEGISACFFVCPNLIGLDRNELASIFPTALGDESRTLTWSEIEHIIDLGHEIGSHTMDHVVLADVTFEEAVRQIRESKEALEARLGTIKHFAWPRGQFHHFDRDLIPEVYAAGYVSCSSAVRGAHLSPVTGHACIRREHWNIDWPQEEMLYLMGRSVRRLSADSGKWPKEWY